MAASIPLRVAIGSALLATCVAMNVLGRAQSGSGWEVPQQVMWALTVGPVVGMVLIVIASVTLLVAWAGGNVSRFATISTVAVLLTSVVLTVTMMFFEPEQWLSTNPNASEVAAALMWLIIPVAGFVFWLVCFYGVANSAFRGVLGALFVITAYTIGVIFFLAGMYSMYPYLS